MAPNEPPGPEHLVVVSRDWLARHPALDEQLRQRYQSSALVIHDRRQRERRLEHVRLEADRRVAERRRPLAPAELEVWNKTGYQARPLGGPQTLELVPIGPSNLEQAAHWLAQEENYRWLDFGLGRQTLDRVSLTVMSKRDIHILRVFTDKTEGNPIGLVALSDISVPFRSATLWYVLGDKNYSGRGYTSKAVAMMLEEGFVRRSLGVIRAWVVEANVPSIRVLEKNQFKFTGRERQCHYIDGRAYDRLLFDILRLEYRPQPAPGGVGEEA